MSALYIRTMKRAATAFILLALILSGSAHAQIEPVETSTLHLLGKGVENRKTGEIILLICTDSCTKLRTVYLTSDRQKAFLFGPATEMTDVKKALKAFTKKFRKERRHDNFFSDRQYDRMRLKMDLVGLGVIGLWCADLFIPGIGLFFVGGALITLSPGFTKYDPRIASFNDQNGWNWSDDTNKISRRNFELILKMQNTQITDLH